MKLTELLSSIEYSVTQGIEDKDIYNVTTDIDKINENTLFVIIRGIKFNTKNIINDIVNKKPYAIICDKDWKIQGNIPIIMVKNARLTLSLLCSKISLIKYESLKFIAVTGTNGKTTTATMIEKILLYCNIKVGFIGTGSIRICGQEINESFYSMTTPDPEVLYQSIKKMQNLGCEIIIMEVSSHALALDKIAPIVFEYSIFTNLSDEHLDFHKNTENYYNSKLKLFRQTKTGIFNADDEYSSRAMRDAFDLCDTTSIGVIWDAEAMAKDIIFDGFGGSSYIYRENGLLFKVHLNLAGHYNIYNSLLALKCAISLGIKPCLAKEAISSIKNIRGRFEIISDSVTVIIDYAHTAEATEKILKTVNSIKKREQNIITVFGCGGERDKQKRPLIGALCEKLSGEVIITNDNPRNEKEEEIINDIISGMSYPEKRKIILDRERAISQAILSADDNDIIMILGKGNENYIIDKNGYHNFDERKIIHKAISKRNEMKAVLK